AGPINSWGGMCLWSEPYCGDGVVFSRRGHAACGEWNRAISVGPSFADPQTSQPLAIAQVGSAFGDNPTGKLGSKLSGQICLKAGLSTPSLSLRRSDTMRAVVLGIAIGLVVGTLALAQEDKDSADYMLR